MVTETTQDLQELIFERPRQAALEPRFSLYMMKGTGISPQCANVLFHWHLVGGIFLAEQDSTLQWWIERQMLKLFRGVPINASVDGFHCLCELQLSN